ncbi:MAG: carboxypeptidase regulatory-like domain-containing protein [Candidatus Omnitrophica bacterium]|nr:carboxypeptidase regulatory-like domain-containing protein [Candidatus Omnitrophota bacterium]
MNIKLILIFLLLIISSINTASADVWTPNSSMVSGLTDVGKYSAPAVFLDDDILKLISGNLDGTFVGWYWSGSIWVEDSSIVSGLGDVGEHSSPALFLDGSTLKLISGDWEGTFTGWYWNGATWVLDASIDSGLGGVGRASRPTVFFDGSTLKLISGEGVSFVFTDTLNGWYWSGSTWVLDASVVSGTSDSVQFSSPSVFNDDGTLKLISGDYWGTFKSWYWSGSTWVSDSSIKSGLGDVGWRSTPHVYLDGSDFKVIAGDESGLFTGWNELHLYALSGTITNESGAVNNATITLSGAGGSTTSNETGYYEITGITSDTYSITVTEALHYNYSDTISITSDNEMNIFLTFIIPETIPVIALPPVTPTEIPVPILVEKTELTVFEESFVNLSDLSILITNLMGKCISWAFLLASYIGAIVSNLLLKGKEEDEEPDVLNVLLFGTIGWVLLLIVNFSGYITIVTTSFALNSLIFGIAGFVVYTILDMVTPNK